MVVHEGRQTSPEKMTQEASRVIGTPKFKLGTENVGKSESRAHQKAKLEICEALNKRVS